MKGGAAHDLDAALTCRHPVSFSEVLSVSPSSSSLHCIADKQPCRLTEGDTKELWRPETYGAFTSSGHTPSHQIHTGFTQSLLPKKDRCTGTLQPWEEANQSHWHDPGGSALLGTRLLPPGQGSWTEVSTSYNGTAFRHRQPRDVRKVSAGEGSIQCWEQLTRVISES